MTERRWRGDSCENILVIVNESDGLLCLNQEHLLLSREYLLGLGVPLSSSFVVTVLRIRGPLDRDTVPLLSRSRPEDHRIDRHAIVVRLGFQRLPEGRPNLTEK